MPRLFERDVVLVYDYTGLRIEVNESCGQRNHWRRPNPAYPYSIRYSITGAVRRPFTRIGMIRDKANKKKLTVLGSTRRGEGRLSYILRDGSLVSLAFYLSDKSSGVSFQGYLGPISPMPKCDRYFEYYSSAKERKSEMENAISLHSLPPSPPQL